MMLKRRLIYILLIGFCCQGFHVLAQPETNLWKFQFALGINSPSGGQSDIYSLNTVNFPSINLGLQHMLNRKWGARLDFGYNRARGDAGSEEIKLNYTRINLQALYDFNQLMNAVSYRMTALVHAGPGLSFSSPLSPYSDNTYTYLNAMAGFEIHYGITGTVSLFTDLSYAFGLSGKDKYDEIADGFSFNGDMIFVTLGVSVSLSGCYFCD